MKFENIEEMADALLSLKYDIIIINLIAICISIIGVYVYARLKKSGELTEINNNFSTVLKQQKELVEETEQIKQSLGKNSISYQIKLNAYHEKSIESINEIYTSIIQLRDSAKDLGFNQGEKEKSNFIKAITEFRNIFDIRKIWIPSELAEHIETVAIEIDNRSHKFIIANTRADYIANISEDRVQKIFDEQDEFFDYIHGEIANVFDELVKNIAAAVRAT
ncbi:MAG: hypothetical protein OQK73_11145 [Gammaproteobacteria bacterium]|nr:hypothetical protein [Gammaproteobacteria bacterium]